jgi:hypothetical protein
MTPEDHETSVRAARGELSSAELAAWHKRMASDASLAREVALDAAVSRGMDRIPSLEPRSDALANILEGAGLAPVHSMENARGGSPWWRRHWAIEAGLVAAAVVVVAVLFVLPNGGDTKPVPQANLVDTSDWAYIDDGSDASVWIDDDADMDADMPSMATPGKPVPGKGDPILAALVDMEMKRAGQDWRIPRADENSSLAGFEDWNELLAGLKY